jgi:hypothetical protein
MTASLSTVRARQRLGRFLVLLVGGALASTPFAVGHFAEIREARQRAEQKYAEWLRNRYGDPASKRSGPGGTPEPGSRRGYAVA